MHSLNYLISHWQPVVGLFIGIIMLILYFYLHVRMKHYCLRLIAKYVFRNENMIPSAESAFNVATSFLFMFGGVWVVLALYYLANG